MAAAHPLHAFTHKKDTDPWPLRRASMVTYRFVDDDPTDQSDDFLKREYGRQAHRSYGLSRDSRAPRQSILTSRRASTR